ncbi:MAG: sigma-70 family RNA polymerase sigma factor [Planctomycetes bacterium]|nr:sigma-70 family RNA polymerase sigma factor [Planctomycetota bacterium]
MSHWNPEALLANAGWMRALARRLVSDADVADDVVQQTWVAALEREPIESPSLRGWLRTVVTNFALRSRRSERNRGRRERAASKTEALPSTGEIVERAAMQHVVAEEVLKLAEPYRSTVLLHFFDGLSSEEIGRRSGVPSATVRGRLMRALDELRRRLDRRHNGDRRAWCVALLPLVVVARPKPAAAAFTGVLAMKLASVVAATIALVVVVIFGWRALGDRTIAPSSAVTALAHESAVEEKPPAQTIAPAIATAAAQSEKPKVTSEPEAARSEPVERSFNEAFASGETYPITVTGHASDESGKPIAGATIWLVSTNGKDAPLGETLSNSDGEFAFHDAPLPIGRWDDTRSQGSFQVFGVAEGRGFAWHGMRYFHPEPRPKNWIVSGEDDSTFPGQPIVTDLRFGPAKRLEGRIVDENGDPIAHAAIGVVGCNYLDVSGHESHVNHREFWAIDQFAEARRSTFTGEDGRFSLEALPAECCLCLGIGHHTHADTFVYAATTDRAITEHNDLIDPKYAHRVSTGVLTITLQSTRVVHVAVVSGESDTPVPRVSVNASSSSTIETGANGTSDANGTVDLKLPPGEFKLTADPPRGSDTIRTQATLVVKAAPAEQSMTVRLKRGCVVILQAVDAATGVGLPGATFETECDDRPGQSQPVDESPSYGGPVKTDASGQARAVVVPGRRRFNYGECPKGYGWKCPNWDPVDLPAGETVYVRFEFVKFQPRPPAEHRSRSEDFPLDPDRVLVAAKTEDAEGRVKLEPGKTPGTFQLAITGRVTWSREPAWPVDVGLRRASDREVVTSSRVDNDAPFTLDADLSPGEYSIESTLPNNAPPKRYMDAWGGRIWINDDGTAVVEMTKIHHLLFLKLLSQQEWAEVAEKRPTVRWTTAEGASSYVVNVIETDRFTRQVISSAIMPRLTVPAYEFASDLVAGHSYQVNFSAFDDAGTLIGHGSGNFYAIK